MLNYAKAHDSKKLDGIFFFDDSSVASTTEALQLARNCNDGKKQKTVSVFRPLHVMPDDVRCVGHAPVDVHLEPGVSRTWKCANCGQTITERLK
jgi:hypothetical protein